MLHNVDCSTNNRYTVYFTGIDESSMILIVSLTILGLLIAAGVLMIASIACIKGSAQL